MCRIFWKGPENRTLWPVSDIIFIPRDEEDPFPDPPFLKDIIEKEVPYGP